MCATNLSLLVPSFIHTNVNAFCHIDQSTSGAKLASVENSHQLITSSVVVSGQFLVFIFISQVRQFEVNGLAEAHFHLYLNFM
jgi:hypothetical protein